MPHQPTGTRIDNARGMLTDLRHGLRVLLQAKGWTAVVVLSLAVGIGANAAIFAAVNSSCCGSYPFDDPDGARPAPLGRQQRHGEQQQRLRDA